MVAAPKKKKKLVLRDAAVNPEDDWQAKDDARTLMRAHAVKSDPKRHAAAKAHAAKQMQAMAAVSSQPTQPADPAGAAGANAAADGMY